MDGGQRFSWVFFLATKDETSGILQNFIRQIKNQLNHRGRNLGEEYVFETPKVKDSGEADISPSGLQATETLVHVASKKTKTYTRKVKSALKKKLDVGVSSGDRKSAFEKFKSASEEIKYGFTNISSGEVRVSQRKGKEKRAGLTFNNSVNIYTDEDWDLIRARMEASTELRKSVFGTDIDAEDYAKKMVELVEKRRREIREQKLKSKERISQ
ncbi:hypothetical protein Tco_1293533 [Tanacetum coccineum]